MPASCIQKKMHCGIYFSRENALQDLHVCLHSRILLRNWMITSEARCEGSCTANSATGIGMCADDSCKVMGISPLR